MIFVCITNVIFPRRMDHHCYWLDTCVGVDNHRVFFIFHGLHVLSQSLLLIFCWRHMENAALKKYNFETIFNFCSLNLLSLLLFTSSSHFFYPSQFSAYLLIPSPFSHLSSLDGTTPLASLGCFCSTFFLASFLELCFFSLSFLCV